jgi:nucleoside-diphosphate-sugar epimerase
MRILILGGTAFLGRAVAVHAIAAGHDVICAARGSAGPVAPGATLIQVDRSVPGGLDPLAGQHFDAVIDVARVPSQVRNALTELAGRVGHWTFVSSCSAYADQSTPGQRAETAALLPPAPPEMDDPEVSPEAYGRCKVAAEEAVLAAGVPAFICRAGLIVGPEDTSDRFTYWPVRLSRGGPVLAPGSPDDLVQLVDVRDLARWLVRIAETGRTGGYDAMSVPMRFSDFLAAVADGVGASLDPVWVPQPFLLDHGVNPWSCRSTPASSPATSTPRWRRVSPFGVLPTPLVPRWTGTWRKPRTLSPASTRPMRLPCYMRGRRHIPDLGARAHCQVGPGGLPANIQVQMRT